MLTDYLARASLGEGPTPVGLGNIDAILNAMEVDSTALALLEEDAIEAEVDQVDIAISMIYNVVEGLKKLTHVDATMATLSHQTLDLQLRRMGLTVEMDTLFTQTEDHYEVSMEGINLTWKEVFRFVRKATQVIVDTLRAFLGRRFTFMGKAYQDARGLKQLLPKVQLANANELMSAKVKLRGTATWIIDDKAKTPQESINLILRTLPEISADLSPKGYRVNLNQIVSTLEGSRNTDPAVIKDMLRVARAELYKEICAYLGCNITEVNTTETVTRVSEAMPGWVRFEATMSKDGYVAPKVKLQSLNTRTKLTEYTMRPVDPHMASEYARAAEAALDLALLLRQDYELVRGFKKQCDNTAKALKERLPETPAEKELFSIFRQVPGYARCFNEPLKVKNELVYRYCVGLLAVIAASRPEWQVRV